ncbi:recombinase family protein [Gordonia sp. DT101]|uniref:recombinase family protein n=1 Tax=Gordonia sp. DT101 TaxID=3416545 RepID=UPI003CF5D486
MEARRRLRGQRHHGKGNKVRPDFERLLADVERGLIDVVVAQEWPRLERNRTDGVRVIETAQRCEILLTFAKGPDIDCTNAMGRLAADLYSAIARNEIEVKGERQSRAQLQRARQGRPPKGQRPVGYATNGDVVEHEAAAIREVFRLFAVADGTTIAGLAAALSGKEGPQVPKSVPRLPRHTRTVMIERNARRVAEGLPPKPVPDDGKWSTSTIVSILRNPRYAGYSVYTNRLDRTKNKRQTWYAQIVKDDDGEPVRGQWEPIVDELTWWRVQERLNEPSRVTNRTGSTTRKHLGSGLYRCGHCEQRVRTNGERYRCEDCGINRTRRHVDDWVLRLIRERLSRPDLADTIPTGDEPRLKAIAADIATRQAKIKRATADYDNEIIEGYDLKRVRERENTAIASLETERRALTATTDLGGVLDAEDPVTAFDDADLMIKRRVIDFFVTVKIHPHPRGSKTFNPATVEVVPKQLG